MDIKTTSCVRDDATGNYVQTMTLRIDANDIDRAILVATGSDGLGDPTTSKGLQQVVFADGTFVICSYRQAVEHAAINPDYSAMIDVAALRVALRQVLN